MTNNWADMANSTLFVAMGSNFVENHPAATAHVMRAHDTRPAATMIVIDPRKSRTALLAENYGGRFIRHRPGTDIAFNNAVARQIIRLFEGVEGNVPQAVRDNWVAFMNQTEDQAFRRNDGEVATPAGIQGSRYTDARFIVNAGGTDYERDMSTDPTDFEYLPAKAADFRDPGTVFSKFKEHIEPYTLDVAAEICGVTEEEIAFVAQAFVDHSRMTSSALTGDSVVGSQDPRDFENYRATQMMYAMGLTQHTHGSQNVKTFANLQILTGNVGRAGGAINALRGIHNVQGSTDMGVLQHLIPGYSGNPGQGVTFGQYTDKLWGQATRFADFQAPDTYALAYDDAYRIKGGLALQADGFYNMTLNWFGDWATVNDMTYYARATNQAERDANDAKRAVVDAIYSLWPKNNGDDHITMFRKASTGDITGMVVWGQNPAVTEPNQSAIRDGFRELDVLVVTDMFETETAAVDRKAGGVTYLFPACSHAEEAGSVANSGRVLQWRERACPPKGNSRSDLELLLRFAYAVDLADGFSHIKDVWDGLGWDVTDARVVYNKLYRDQYGWSPADAAAFEEVSAVTEMWYANKDAPEMDTVYGSEVVAENIYKQCCPVPAAGGTMWLYLDAYNTDLTQTARLHTGQDPWLCANRSKQRATADPNGTYAYPGWGYSWLVNRRVLYNNGDVPGDVGDGYQGPDRCARLFVCQQPGTISYANNNWRLVHGLSDMPDNAGTSPVHSVGLPGRFPAHVEPYETPLEVKNPDMLTIFGRNTRGVAKWDLIHTGTAATGAAYEPSYVATNDADYPATHRKDPSDYPLVLTTIRCVEHFQGGPITRNNAWNVEREPIPWIEINSVDANALGIQSGDMINVITARADTANQGDLLDPASPHTDSGFSQGFIARVGVGTESNQRVGVGVVAIPWHWGDKGLSTGSRANDLCIDSFDANTRIPEYKACLCRIEKM